MARKPFRMFGGKRYEASNFMLPEWKVDAELRRDRKKGLRVRKTPGPLYKDGSGRRWWHVWYRRD